MPISPKFNTDESRKRFALYQNEKIPTNERNLTDVRTRLGVLIEFELARISNAFLQEFGITDFFWTYVVANRFPDLEIRNKNGERYLRLEIKTLQCVAEEKSANFDTLLKDIHPKTDFVVVFLWDWKDKDSQEFEWDSAPFLFSAFVFNAYSLALMRDTYWLNRPPKNLGNGRQGFDIRYAVTCENGVYSKEQGNYGKLTRIWKKSFEYRPRETQFIKTTEADYLSFLDEIIESGFDILAKKHFQSLFQKSPEKILHDRIFFYKGENVAYILEYNHKVSKEILAKLCKSHNLSYVVVFTSKYRCSAYLFSYGKLEMICSGLKPKNLLKELNSLRPSGS